MSRARNIKPGFYRDASLVELPVETRLLFPGLWMLADRAGRLEDRPKQIKMEIYPADSFDVDSMLNQLQEAGLIVRYEADGARYIQVKNFEKHQNPHRDEKASSIPAPCEHSVSTVQAPCEYGGNRADSLIPDSLIPEVNHHQEQPIVVETLPQATPAATAKRGTRLPADWQLPMPWGEWALTERPQWTADDVRRSSDKFRDYWHGLSGQKATKADWLATWRNWVRNENGPPARASPASRAEERQRVGDILTGRAGNERHHSTERDITGESFRVA